MGFGTNMQSVAQNLISKFGNSCELTQVYVGEYNNSTGTTTDYNNYINSKSVPLKDEAIAMSLASAMNFNLAGFGKERVMLPFIDGYELEQTWLYNGTPIKTIDKIEADDVIIAYIIEVGTE